LRAEHAEDLEALARSARDAERDRDTIDDLQRGARADRETIRELREQAGHDAAHIGEIEHDAVAAVRIEAPQQALIADLRSEVREAAVEAADIGAHLAAAERELVDLRAIRDALVSPTLVQRDGMTIVAKVIPAELTWAETSTMSARVRKELLCWPWVTWSAGASGPLDERHSLVRRWRRWRASATIPANCCAGSMSRWSSGSGGAATS
jgi:hypothetical protein